VASRFVRQALQHKQGGTTTRTVQGRGWTVQEAWTNAMQEDLHENGREYGGENNVRDAGQAKQIKAPKKPTKVQVIKKEIGKGPVIKKYLITPYFGVANGGGNSPFYRDKRSLTQYDKPADALIAAKELALQYGESLRVSLQALCQGNTTLAEVVPERGEPGVWQWSVDFRT